MDFDFPKVPDWFNEGLASLHQQCNFQSDASGPWIEGQINWHIAGPARSNSTRAFALATKSLVEENDFRGKLDELRQARCFCCTCRRKAFCAITFAPFATMLRMTLAGLRPWRRYFLKLIGTSSTANFKIGYRRWTDRRGAYPRPIVHG